MFNITMNHYVTKTNDGLVHVQNAVMGHFGQHHVHTEKGFEEWVRKHKIPKENIIELEGKNCDCGLKAGEYINGLPKPK